MKTINSLSGGKSSSYIAKNYPADYDVFALVRTNDKKLKYPDKGIRKTVSLKLQKDFIGTLEMDAIIPIMLELEQFIGREIFWVSGETFDDIIKKKGNYLPNLMARYCTTELKMKPIFEWWQRYVKDICYMNIGFRFGEEDRMVRMQDKLNSEGLDTYKAIVGTRKSQNKWGDIAWRIPKFPLIENRIRKDMVDAYWKNKPVPFIEGYYNNCVGCFHKNPLLLSMMNRNNSDKMKWFERKEDETGNRFRKEITFKQINAWKPYAELTFSDFTDCDSGYCGL
jgi:hypothetical protein